MCECGPHSPIATHGVWSVNTNNIKIKRVQIGKKAQNSTISVVDIANDLTRKFRRNKNSYAGRFADPKGSKTLTFKTFFKILIFV